MCCQESWKDIAVTHSGIASSGVSNVGSTLGTLLPKALLSVARQVAVGRQLHFMLTCTSFADHSTTDGRQRQAFISATMSAGSRYLLHPQ